MSKRVLVVSAGGHGQVVADILQAMHAHEGVVIPIGFVDDDPALEAHVCMGLPIFGPVSSVRNIDHDTIIVAIGDNSRRRIVTESLVGAGEQLTTVIHPRAIVAPSSFIGAGAMICAAAVVGPASVIGIGTILNTSCSVDHHNKIGDFAHIGPGARLGGEVTIGAGSLLGIGSVVLPRLRIGARSTVAGGAVVTRDVDDETTVIGVPAIPYARRVRT